jgi:hypothetical protein
MAETSLVQQATVLSSTLKAIEDRLVRGTGPVDELEDFKSALDDMRLRLWGLLRAAGGKDYHSYQERFRIQRATEMCRGLSGDLLDSQMSGRHPELAGLHDAAGELCRGIEQARQHAF